jgi:succinate-semialdehyde dehydrogenase / glutarate-semialdehyde dehydrogenase
MSRTMNAGQACIAAKRFIVMDEVYDDFVSGLAESFKGLRPGDPTDPSTRLGPLSSEKAAADLTAQVQDAVEKGATVLAGGGRPDREGAFVEATLLADVTPEMRAYSEELFGPVAVVHRVSSEEEAVRLANDTEYGLVAYVYTGDLARGLRVSEAIEAGMVGLNRGIVSDPAAPFGGVKQSGIGREGGHHGLLEFVEPKYFAFDEPALP